ncbi:MAG: tetratricopeptide repeat protein [Cyclobacteriaceae bacterium]
MAQQPTPFNNIGIILKNQGKYDESLVYYHKSLAIAKDYDDKSKMANAYNNLAQNYIAIDEFGKAEELSEGH